MTRPKNSIIHEPKRRGFMPISETVVKNLPGGFDHPSTILLAAVKKTAKIPMVPIRDKKPPIIAFFIGYDPLLIILKT